MAKDDYHVIIYQVLSYLYQCLKKGKAVEPEALQNNSILFQINEKYWEFIIINLINDGLIEGPMVTTAWGRDPAIENLEFTRITSKGIEYLLDNSFIQKAKRFAKDIKKIVPFGLL